MGINSKLLIISDLIAGDINNDVWTERVTLCSSYLIVEDTSTEMHRERPF